MKDVNRVKPDEQERSKVCVSCKGQTRAHQCHRGLNRQLTDNIQEAWMEGLLLSLSAINSSSWLFWHLSSNQADFTQQQLLVIPISSSQVTL